MRNQFAARSDAAPQRPRRSRPVRAVAAALLLVFGTLFERIGALLTGTAQRWTDPRTVTLWRRAVNHFYGGLSGQRQPNARWERTLVRVGASVIIGIGSTLLLMWLLLLTGGTLMWLALHGYGHFLLLGAVVVGALVGWRLSKQGRYGSEQDRLN